MRTGVFVEVQLLRKSGSVPLSTRLINRAPFWFHNRFLFFTLKAQCLGQRGSWERFWFQFHTLRHHTLGSGWCSYPRFGPCLRILFGGRPEWGVCGASNRKMYSHSLFQTLAPSTKTQNKKDYRRDTKLSRIASEYERSVRKQRTKEHAIVTLTIWGNRYITRAGLSSPQYQQLLFSHHNSQNELRQHLIQLYNEDWDICSNDSNAGPRATEIWTSSCALLHHSQLFLRHYSTSTTQRHKNN